MKPEITSNKEKKFKIKITKFSIIGFIGFLILGGVFATLYYNFSFFKNQETELQIKTITKNNFSIIVSGSGPIVAFDKSDVIPNISGILSKIHFNEGDKVKAGQVLYELDSLDAQTNIEKIESSIKQLELTQKNYLDSIQKLNVFSPFSGVVSGLSINEGDMIMKNSPILTLTDTSKLKVILPFNASHIREIKIGQSAELILPDFMQSISGKVSYISNKSYTTLNGGELYDVEFTANNTGSLKDGVRVSAKLKIAQTDIYSTEYGMFSYVQAKSLKCEQDGIVNKLLIKENNFINKGDLIAVLINQDIDTAYKTNMLKIQDLYIQLNAAKKQLSNYTIVCPIDGIIVKQDLKVGDLINMGQALSTISNSDSMKFDVPVDELDIPKIKLGQDVDITVDALEETKSNKIKGIVYKISIEGSTSNGITSYPVTILINNSTVLKSGMNADALINVSKKENVIGVPIEAVHKYKGKSYVFLKPSNDNSNKVPFDKDLLTSLSADNKEVRDYYEKTVPRAITIGLKNETDYEVLKGLKENDKIVLPPSLKSTNTLIGGRGGL